MIDLCTYRWRQGFIMLEEVGPAYVFHEVDLMKPSEAAGLSAHRP
jgi:hypothetical protein